MKKQRNILTDICLEFCKILDKYTKYIVVSGFFIICSGRSRATEDIDIIIDSMNFKEFEEMYNELKLNGFTCLQSNDPIEVYNLYLKENIPVRFIKDEKFIPNIELKFKKDYLDEYQIHNRQIIKFTGLDIYFSSIEACIAFKEELLKSKKDLDDAKFLRIVYKEKINENEIEKIKKMIHKYRF
ncbi:MAG: hypothetical protein ACTSPQ_07285 [Candidatus Helarchaeota archaeon]